MNRKKLSALGAITSLLLIIGLWLTAHRDAQQGNPAGAAVFTDLKPSLGDVEEIRLTKGDGAKTTLRRTPAGWTVVERQYPADGSRVRELLLGLVGMKIVEHKTSDPANYPKLGVDAPSTPTATGTLLEVVAGKKTWSLIVGKGAEGRALYVRKPDQAQSELVEPNVTADPDQKRWVDRLIVDLSGAGVQEISVKPAAGPAYLLTRAKRGDASLALSPVPAGRIAASSMVIDGQADALASFNFDEVRAAPAAAAATDRAVYRTFDGQVFEFAGHRDAAKTYLTVTASKDAALAAKFAAEAAKPDAAKPDAAKPDATKPDVAPAAPKADIVDRLASRATGVEYEIPVYKYEAIFKPLEDLLEKKPEPAAAAKKPPPATEMVPVKKTLPTKP